jgi:hypothetical protein
MVAVTLLAACSGPPAASPTDEPSGDPAASGASPSADASPTASPQRALATLEPDDKWRPVLELVSGPGGVEEGSFDTGARYRIRYDCVGDGSIAVRVANRVRVRRDCGDQSMAEPEVVRSGGGRLRARVAAQGEVEWIVHLEVPR